MNDNPFTPPASNLNLSGSFGETINEELLDRMKRTRWWAKVGAQTLSFIFLLEVIGVINAFVRVVGSDVPQRAIGTMFFAFIFVLWPALRLFDFARRIDWFLEERTERSFEATVYMQGGFWRHAGILVVLFLISVAIGASAFAKAKKQYDRPSRSKPNADSRGR